VEELKAGTSSFSAPVKSLKMYPCRVYVGDGKFIQAAKSKEWLLKPGLIRNITLKG